MAKAQKKTNPWVFTAIFIVAALLTAIIVLLVGLFATYLHRKKHSIEELTWSDVAEVLGITFVAAIVFYALAFSVGWLIPAIVYLILAIALYYLQKAQIKRVAPSKK